MKIFNLRRAMRAVLLLLLMSAGVTKVFAQIGNYFWYGNLQYQITSINPPHVQLCGVNESVLGTLNIPSYVTYNNQDYDVTKIYANAFNGNAHLTQVKVPRTVTVIAGNAFRDCANLETVVLPEELVTLSPEAFVGCSKLKYFKAPVNVEREDINILPSSMTVIYGSTFTNCTSLESIYIPSDVTVIQDGAFYGCTSLEDVFVFSTTPPTLGQNVFYNMPDNGKIYVPAGSLNSYKTATNWSAYADRIVAMPAYKFLTYTFDVVDNRSVATVSGYRAGMAGELVIPNKVYVYNGQSVPFDVVAIDDNDIDHGAFNNCTSLTKVTFPNTMQSIENYAFVSCSNLAEVDFSACTSLTNLGASAFAYTALTSVSLPSTLTEIKNAVFNGCSSLALVDIPNGVRTIGVNAFRNTFLASLTLPASVGSIGQHAFEQCNNLSIINAYRTTPPVLDLGAFPSSDQHIITVYVPNGSAAAYQNNHESGYVQGWGDHTNFTFVELPANTLLYSYDDVNHTATLTGYVGEVSGVLDIPSIVTKDNVNYNVTAIGDNVFMGCSNLRGVTFPATLTSLGKYAFRECTGITSLVIPSTLTTIGDGAFLWCISLGEVSLPDNMTHIGKGMFEGAAFTEIQLPNSLQVIDQLAFYGTSLITLTIPESVTTIGAQAFKDCLDLQYVIALPTTPPTITANSFEDVEDIPLYVPAASVSAYQNATGWSQFTNIQAVIDPNQYITYTYNENDHTATVTGLSQQCSGALVIPGTVTYNNATYTVTAIADNAFSYNTGLTSVNIAHTVETIGEYAFSGCTGVTDLTIGRNVKTIGKYAFSICTSLTNIVYYAVGCENVATAIWSGTTANKTLTIKNSVRSIPNYAFYNLRNLASVTIPDNTESIGTYAFSNCTELTTVTFGYKLKTIGPGAFKNSGITSIDMNNVEIAYDGAFSNCTNLSTVTLRNSMTQIWSGLFEGCTALESVDIPSAVTYISAHAFSGCTSLATLSTAGYASNLTAIDIEAFSGCTALTAIDIPNSVTTINDYAFKNCTALKNITLGTGLTTMGNYVFQFCQALENIDYYPTNISVNSTTWSTAGSTSTTVLKVKEGVQTLPVNAFSNLQLKQVNLPGTLQTIGESSFYSTGLTSVTIPNSVTTIGNNAFYLCNLSTITLGSSLVNIGEYAFAGSNSIATITSYNTVPPAVTANAFSNYNATLKVLAPAMDAYTGHEVWRSFTIESLDGYYFTGATDNNWGTASNWSNGEVPTTDILNNDPTDANVSILADATVNIDNAYAFNLIVMDGNVLTVTDENKLKLGYYRGMNSDNGSFTATDASALVIEEGGNLMNAFEMQATVEKNITGYDNSSGNWNFISSPLKGEYLYNDEYYYDNPEDIGNLIEGNYDLYLFDQTQIGMEWRNYKAHTETFRIRRGQGYLYANEENTTLQFAGTIAAIEDNEKGTYSVELSYQNEAVQVENPDAPEGYEYVYPQLAGWNLIGNPFMGTAYQDMMGGPTFSFYMMDAQGTALAEEGATNAAIPACTGIFVKSDSPYQTFTFTTQNLEMMRPNNGSLQVTLQQTVERGAVATIDKAIVSFNEGSMLEKFVFNAETSKLFIPQDGKDYAIVWSEGRGEVPVNFKATRNGCYTITVCPSEVSMSYLHLIDNLTGDNIDLLETQNYTFEARTNDYASRFKLVFACGDANDDNEPFTFFNGSEWVISNEGLATLQFVDVMGRVLRSETIEGNATLNTNRFSAGIYMMRLISGENVRVQKIVVR